MSKYHSQPATRQDEWVIKKNLGRKCGRGYFVEIGAHNGVRHSNTLALEQWLGWNGLLVEANPSLYNECVKNRPNVKVVQAAVGPSNEDGLNFLLGDSYGGLRGFMCDEWRREHEARKTPCITVNTVSLRTLLTDLNAPQIIDYLSLDVEGAEYPILESFFDNRNLTHLSRIFQFRFITVEFRYDSFMLERLERLLEPDYVLDEVRAFDACFVNRSIG